MKQLCISPFYAFAQLLLISLVGSPLQLRQHHGVLVQASSSPSTDSPTTFFHFATYHIEANATIHQVGGGYFGALTPSNATSPLEGEVTAIQYLDSPLSTPGMWQMCYTNGFIIPSLLCSNTSSNNDSTSCANAATTPLANAEGGLFLNTGPFSGAPPQVFNRSTGKEISNTLSYPYPASFNMLSTEGSGGMILWPGGTTSNPTAWISPWGTNKLLAIDLVTGDMINHTPSNGLWGQNPLGSLHYLGGCYLMDEDTTNNQNNNKNNNNNGGGEIWMGPNVVLDKSPMIRIRPFDDTAGSSSAVTTHGDLSTTPLTQSNWPGAFGGSVHDGVSLWLISGRYTGGVARFNLSSLTFTHHPAPSEYDDFTGEWGHSGGGTFDGANIWMGPSSSPYVVKITGAGRNPSLSSPEVVLLSNFPAGAPRSGFASALFDSRYVWFVPLYTLTLLRVDSATDSMKVFHLDKIFASAFASSTEKVDWTWQNGLESMVVDFPEKALVLSTNQGKIVRLHFEERTNTSSSSSLINSSDTVFPPQPTASPAPLSPVAYLQSGFYFIGFLQNNDTNATRAAADNDDKIWTPASVDTPLEGDFVEVFYHGDGPASTSGSGGNNFAYAGGWVSVLSNTTTTAASDDDSRRQIMLAPGNRGGAPLPTFQDALLPGTTIDGDYSWPSSSTDGAERAFSGFVLHPASSTMWLVPWPSSVVFAVPMDGTNKIIERFSLPSSGGGSGYFAGGCVHNGDVWMMPTKSEGDPALRIQLPGAAEELSYPDSITNVRGITTGVFNGAVYDGASLWMVPYEYDDKLVRFDLAAMRFVRHDFTSTYSGLAGGGVYDGETVWMGPRSSGVVLKIAARSRTTSALSNWPSGVDGSGFNSALFDTKYVWLIPLFNSAIVRIDASTGAMKGFLLGTDIRGSSAMFCQSPVLDTPNQMLHLGLVSGKIVSLKFSREGEVLLSPDGSSVMLGSSNEEEEESLGQGAIVGIVFGCLVGVIIILSGLLLVVRRRSSDSNEEIDATAPANGADSGVQHQLEHTPSRVPHTSLSQVSPEPVLGVPVVASSSSPPPTTSSIYGQTAGGGAPLGYPTSTPPPQYHTTTNIGTGREDLAASYSNPCTPPDCEEGIINETHIHDQHAGGGQHREFGQVEEEEEPAASPHVEIVMDDDHQEMDGERMVQPVPPSYSAHLQQQQQQQNNVARDEIEAFSPHNCDRSLALVPCGHDGACRRCAGSALDKFCPTCGTRIEGLTKKKI